jgi:hypothetical protein
MLALIFGSIRLILGLVIGLYAFNILKPSQTGFLSKNPVVARILAILLIASGAYTLLFSNADTYKVGSVFHRWTEEDKAVMVKNCLRDSKGMDSKFPKEMQEYCNCSVDAIMKNLSKEEYEESLQTTFEERTKKQLPYFSHCLIDLQAATENKK